MVRLWHADLCDLVAELKVPASTQCPLAQMYDMLVIGQLPSGAQHCLIDKTAPHAKALQKGDHTGKGGSTYVGDALTVTTHAGLFRLKAKAEVPVVTVLLM